MSVLLYIAPFVCLPLLTSYFVAQFCSLEIYLSYWIKTKQLNWKNKAISQHTTEFFSIFKNADINSIWRNLWKFRKNYFIFHRGSIKRIRRLKWCGTGPKLIARSFNAPSPTERFKHQEFAKNRCASLQLFHDYIQGHSILPLRFNVRSNVIM